MALLVKNLPANAGDVRDAGSILGQKDPLEKEMATHSSIHAWEIPWSEEPGSLQSMRLKRIGPKLATKQQALESRCGYQDFPGNPAVHSAVLCRGHGFHPWLGN